MEDDKASEPCTPVVADNICGPYGGSYNEVGREAGSSDVVEQPDEQGINGASEQVQGEQESQELEQDQIVDTNKRKGELLRWLKDFVLD
ncbi:hypothetical protein NDU88_005812 [Pleurodeles waltl]|uniref:Uncharacterized protein n=1 Tax=Pleurodeles waltl TaxID=8319 RepID=A0AAV7X2C4_PLEWA|nr:hypothetical protein NDU88_005812 [Pleurodeles waltl]